MFFEFEVFASLLSRSHLAKSVLAALEKWSTFYMHHRTTI